MARDSFPRSFATKKAPQLRGLCLYDRGDQSIIGNSASIDFFASP